MLKFDVGNGQVVEWEGKSSQSMARWQLRVRSGSRILPSGTGIGSAGIGPGGGGAGPDDVTWFVGERDEAQPACIQTQQPYFEQKQALGAATTTHAIAQLCDHIESLRGQHDRTIFEQRAEKEDLERGRIATITQP
ncbi:hypothetical protein TI39_contig5826g00001 [Zymoseptoria brevis]|uniref:Uncharacterized protein n=1 Tax=Zymoseptoria brevis TaxID=1047168 RepID=A0A0F4G5X8_9PEZI|nr:hypothetical protein TI39_contig5826g00001 [Zymoseptoria brevis]